MTGAGHRRPPSAKFNSAGRPPARRLQGIERVQVHVIKGKKINWPRFENDEYIMTVGAYRPLDDALRIAFTELVGWIHSDYGLSEMDAYELLSKTAEIRLSEMVDPNYVIVAKVKKSFLPSHK